MPTNGEAVEFERERLSGLAAQSERDDVVLVEVLYRTKWVRFDVSAMEAQYLSDAEFMARYIVTALAAVALPRTAGSSSEPVSQS